MQSSVALRFDLAREQSSAVKLKERLEKIGTASVHNLLDLIVARVVKEALIVEVGLVKLDRATIVAEHELLEGHEAHVPRITFLIGHEL